MIKVQSALVYVFRSSLPLQGCHDHGKVMEFLEFFMEKSWNFLAKIRGTEDHL